MIKGIRRSLKGEKRTSSGSSSNHLHNGPTSPTGGGGISQKSSLATTPPKKIIKALYDYNSQGPGELSFKMGDFLYVVGNEEDEEWYEACDPPSNLRGMVPVSYFQVISAGEQAVQTVPLSDLAGKNSSVSAAAATTSDHKHSMSSGNTSSGRSSQGKSPLYGVVLYDFVAERPDELQANAGESIIVIAQSNEEWFVAKPIGRLGGPGLIPVSFIEIRDLTTGKIVENVGDAVRKAGVPKVEEWKRMAAEYKASSIPLGKFDDNNSAPSGSGHEQQRDSANSGGSASQQSSRHSNNSHVVSASVDRYAFDGGRYWYLVVAEMSNGRYRNLCRYYQDFYDFQIKLLDEFPEEAGRTGKQRTLPFMPGPLTYVNDSISSQRRANLDDYVRNLTMMLPYISRSPTVQQLFALRTGDIETPYLTNTMPQPPNNRSSSSNNTTARSSTATNNNSNQMSNNNNNNNNNNNSMIESSSSVSITSESNHTNTSSIHNDDINYDSNNNTNNDEHTTTTNDDNDINNDDNSNNNDNNDEFSADKTPTLQPSYEQQEQKLDEPHRQHQRLNSQSTVTDHHSRQQSQPRINHHQPTNSVATSQHSSKPSDSGSPGKHDSSFVKVKVFHDDDLIAIRVPSSVTFGNLSARITERLNLDSVALLYKDDSTGQFDEIIDDETFSRALNGKTKLVLYAK